jgi:hypothetical protein
MPMKARHFIIVLVIILAGAWFMFYLFTSPRGPDQRMGNAIQAGAVFAALIAAVIALAGTDPKTRRINIAITPSIALEEIGTHVKAELPPPLRAAFDQLPEHFSSHRVYFKMTNDSGFSLAEPCIAFRLPIAKRHPHQIHGNHMATFNSNLFNSQEHVRALEFGDTQIISNRNVPYWNEKEELTIWIRMALGEAHFSPFEVTISINCQNAEGITKKVEISHETPRT